MNRGPLLLLTVANVAFLVIALIFNVTYQAAIAGVAVGAGVAVLLNGRRVVSPPRDTNPPERP